jgi:hypothetical protein
MKKFFILQILVLLAGTLFAWYNVVINFLKFYAAEGTLFKLQNCTIPNPVTEPCFYGAIGFLVALVWAIAIYNQPTKTHSQDYLWWFLGAGTIFAWFNVAKEFVKFYAPHTGAVLGCSATPITNPFLTPCFTGASIFLLATILAGYIYYELRK